MGITSSDISSKELEAKYRPFDTLQKICETGYEDINIYCDSNCIRENVIGDKLSIFPIEEYIFFMERNGYKLKDARKKRSTETFLETLRFKKDKKSFTRLQKWRVDRQLAKQSFQLQHNYYSLQTDEVLSSRGPLGPGIFEGYYVNYILIGPHASGKTYIYYRTNAEKRVKKVLSNESHFKRFAKPTVKDYGNYSYIVPTQDIQEIIGKIKNREKRIVFCVCYCDLDVHLSRYCRRERVRRKVGRKVGNFEASMGYDYRGLCGLFGEHNIQYVILDTAFGHTIESEKYYGPLP